MAIRLFHLDQGTLATRNATLQTASISEWFLNSFGPAWRQMIEDALKLMPRRSH